VTIRFKDNYIQKRWPEVHPILREIAQGMDQWLHGHDKTHLMISDSVTTLAIDTKYKRVSSSHRDGRAFDIDVTPEGEKAWSKDKTFQFMSYFGEAFRKYGAKGKDGVRRFLVHHDSGRGVHFHVQIGIDVVETLRAKYPEWDKPNEKHPQTKPKEAK
jgi:hypothetical protein